MNHQVLIVARGFFSKLLEQIGTALKGELISPNVALEWAEEVAPGCVGFIPTTVYLAGVTNE